MSISESEIGGVGLCSLRSLWPFVLNRFFRLRICERSFYISVLVMTQYVFAAIFPEHLRSLAAGS